MKLTALVCGVAVGGLLALGQAQAADLLYSQPAPAMAQSYGGPYVGVKGGVNFTDDDENFSSDGVVAGGAIGSIDIDRDTGFDVGVVAGYSFGSRWGMFSPRLEVEYGYLSNDVDGLTARDAAGAPIAGANSGSDDGEINASYGLVNLLLDIPVGWGFTPFVGGGIGYANVRFDNINNDAALGAAVAGTTLFDDEDTVFAWSLTAGVSFDISRNVSIDVAYRFLQFTDVEIQDETAAAGTTNSSEDDLDNHQVNVGVRVHL